YLTAAEAEEFGLESGRPRGTNSVTLTTVHAAKGLQWAAVVVPGLSAGAKARVFPARPAAGTRWTENPRLLPFPLPLAPPPSRPCPAPPPSRWRPSTTPARRVSWPRSGGWRTWR